MRITEFLKLFFQRQRLELPKYLTPVLNLLLVLQTQPPDIKREEEYREHDERKVELGCKEVVWRLVLGIDPGADNAAAVGPDEDKGCCCSPSDVSCRIVGCPADEAGCSRVHACN